MSFLPAILLLLKVTSFSAPRDGYAQQRLFRHRTLYPLGHLQLLVIGAGVEMIGAGGYLLIASRLLGPVLFRHLTVGLASAAVVGSLRSTHVRRSAGCCFSKDEARRSQSSPPTTTATAGESFFQNPHQCQRPIKNECGEHVDARSQRNFRRSVLLESVSPGTLRAASLQGRQIVVPNRL